MPVCVEGLNFGYRIGLSLEKGICPWVWDGAIGDFARGEPTTGDGTGCVAETETFGFLLTAPCCGRSKEGSLRAMDRPPGLAEAVVGAGGGDCSSSLEDMSIMGANPPALDNTGSSSVKSMTTLDVLDSDERGLTGFFADANVVSTGSEARGRLEVIANFFWPADRTSSIKRLTVGWGARG